MSFDDSFRKDRPNKMLQITPSRLVAALARRRGAGRLPLACSGALVLLLAPPAGHVCSYAGTGGRNRPYHEGQTSCLMDGPRILHWFRRLVVRYEFHAENFLGMVRLGCMKIMLRYL